MRWCRKKVSSESTETRRKPTTETIVAVDAARGQLVRRRLQSIVGLGVLIAVVFQLLGNWEMAISMTIDGIILGGWDASLQVQASDAMVFATSCAVFVAAITIAAMTAQPASEAGAFVQFGQARWKERATNIAEVGAASSFAFIVPAWAHSGATGLALLVLSSLATGLAAITVVAAVPNIERVESEKRQRALVAMDERMQAYPFKDKKATSATLRRNAFLGLALLALQVAAAIGLAWATRTDPALKSWELVIAMSYLCTITMGLYGLVPILLIQWRWACIDRQLRGWKALVTVGTVLLFVFAVAHARALIAETPALNAQTLLCVFVVMLWWPVMLACAQIAAVQWRIGPLAALRHAIRQSRAREAERAETRAVAAEGGHGFLLD